MMHWADVRELIMWGVGRMHAGKFMESGESQPPARGKKVMPRQPLTTSENFMRLKKKGREENPYPGTAG